MEPTPRVPIAYSVANVRTTAARTPQGIVGTAPHPQAALPARTVETTFAESVSRGHKAFWQDVERPLWGALGDARLLVDHTPGMPPAVLGYLRVTT
jgi:hypothetical protein